MEGEVVCSIHWLMAIKKKYAAKGMVCLLGGVWNMP